MAPARLLADLRACVGPEHVLTGDDAAPYLTDWRKTVTGRAVAVVRPANRDEVAQVVRLCAAAGAPMVPQGGNTGQVAAATPDASGSAVVLSLVRLNRVRAIDPDNDTITVEAGCVLQAVQEAAREAGRLFPLSLGGGGQLHDRREPGDQCRGDAGLAIWQRTRVGVGAGGGHARGRNLGRAAWPAQGQYRL